MHAALAHYAADGPLWPVWGSDAETHEAYSLAVLRRLNSAGLRAVGLALEGEGVERPDAATLAAAFRSLMLAPGALRIEHDYDRGGGPRSHAYGLTYYDADGPDGDEPDDEHAGIPERAAAFVLREFDPRHRERQRKRAARGGAQSRKFWPQELLWHLGKTTAEMHRAVDLPGRPVSYKTVQRARACLHEIVGHDRARQSKTPRPAEGDRIAALARETGVPFLTAAAQYRKREAKGIADLRRKHRQQRDAEQRRQHEREQAAEAAQADEDDFDAFLAMLPSTPAGVTQAA
ncbi:hypothetical protein [Agrococcus sp. SGAir0287]|uniref:hypothetical protein n=1 Tax=Agrococcus sp. SGAir0287 TaxID=2070347 RepID=UPI0010CD02EB|nr:hypothetical protein [Agrococcus sp. SGAir0287]QCR18572.1 hypothetical protein C1N71_03170 [Agrococcus sp. SGAir0287]